MEPKIYIGKRSFELLTTDYDVFIFLPEDFKGNTDKLMIDARNKFIELSDRKRFIDIKESRPSPIRQLPDGVIREKRKRIVR